MSDNEPTEIEKLKAQIAEKDERHKRQTEINRSQYDKLSTANRDIAKLKNDNNDLRDKLRTISTRTQASRNEGVNEFGTFVRMFDDTSAYVYVNRKLLRLQAMHDVDIENIKQGETVRLNKDMTIIDVDKLDKTGVTCKLQEVMESEDEAGLKRLRVSDGINDSMIVFAASSLDGELASMKPGCTLLVNKDANFAFEIVEEQNEAELDLEQVPDVTYDDIGGLDKQVQQIYDEIEMPMIHKELYAKYGVTMPKGVLLYGPPGCGKTMIAKAIANSIASKVKDQTGAGTGKAYFVNIKGPELLNKYVGETERHIRELFQKARDRASSGTPVVVFFDEMESLFSVRGSGISSDVEKTIVPQLLSEIDGVEGMENVLIVGASNREDMIDPAVLRPGRIDIKIEVDRPDMQQAKDILQKYISRELPIASDLMTAAGDDRQLAVSKMVDATALHMYRETPETRVHGLVDSEGNEVPAFYMDFMSGAMIKNIVDRAKKLAIKSEIETGEDGMRASHLIAAVDQEYSESKHIAQSITNSDAQRINRTRVRRRAQEPNYDNIPTVETTGDLVNDDTGRMRSRQENEGTGQYL